MLPSRQIITCRFCSVDQKPCEFCYRDSHRPYRVYVGPRKGKPVDFGWQKLRAHLRCCHPAIFAEMQKTG